jgi:serine/threonine protein kinase
VTLRPHGRLGPYELEAAIGEGGLGEIWKAHDTTNGRQVALRVLPSPPPGDLFRFVRFEDDIRRVARLRHPNLASVYALIDCERVRAIACEWVPGNSLAQRIASGPIPVDESVRIVAQMANGLAAAHARNLVHGDLKPSNIAFTADGVVKVVNFGLMGTYNPAGTIDSRSDVWAFGCTLFEMLTGKPPFKGPRRTRAAAQPLRAEPEWRLLPPSVPAPLVKMLRGCLEKDAAHRIQRLTHVLAPIRRTIAEEGAVALFLRRSALMRSSRSRVLRDRNDDTLAHMLLRHLPSLQRWAIHCAPEGVELDTVDIVLDAVARTARHRLGHELRTRGLLSDYLRYAIEKRIDEEVRRQRAAQEVAPEKGVLDTQIHVSLPAIEREDAR